MRRQASTGDQDLHRMSAAVEKAEGGGCIGELEAVSDHAVSRDHPLLQHLEDRGKCADAVSTGVELSFFAHERDRVEHGWLLVPPDEDDPAPHPDDLRG